VLALWLCVSRVWVACERILFYKLHVAAAAFEILCIGRKRKHCVHRQDNHRADEPDSDPTAAFTFRVVIERTPIWSSTQSWCCQGWALPGDWVMTGAASRTVDGYPMVPLVGGEGAIEQRCLREPFLGEVVRPRILLFRFFQNVLVNMY
jgi:hypothetical protein